MPNKKPHSTVNAQSQKLLAIQLAAQLPMDRSQALAVIDHARWLIENFLTEGRSPAADPKSGLTVIRSGIDPAASRNSMQGQ